MQPLSSPLDAPAADQTGGPAEPRTADTVGGQPRPEPATPSGPQTPDLDRPREIAGGQQAAHKSPSSGGRAQPRRRPKNTPDNFATAQDGTLRKRAEACLRTLEEGRQQFEAWQAEFEELIKTATAPAVDAADVEKTVRRYAGDIAGGVGAMTEIARREKKSREQKAAAAVSSALSDLSPESLDRFNKDVAAGTHPLVALSRVAPAAAGQ